MLIAGAIAAGDLSLYAAAYRRIVRAPERLTHATLLLTRHDALRSRVIGVLGRDPRLFARLLEAQNGEASLAGAAPALAKLATRAVLGARGMRA